MARAIQTFHQNVFRRATRLVTRVATVRIVQYHHFTSSRRVSSRTDARVVDANQGDESDFPDLSAGLVTVACDEERDAESAGASGTRPRESRE
jgi:hypothetical protein